MRKKKREKEKKKTTTKTETKEIEKKSKPLVVTSTETEMLLPSPKNATPVQTEGRWPLIPMDRNWICWADAGSNPTDSPSRIRNKDRTRFLCHSSGSLC